MVDAMLLTFGVILLWIATNRVFKGKAERHPDLDLYIGKIGFPGFILFLAGIVLFLILLNH